MKHTEKELLALRESLNEMWNLVMSQLEKSRTALLTSDSELAREVTFREKRVDAYELKLDSDCENFIALYAPVAIDLRMVLSIMKIGQTLERIGDFADGIARFVVDDLGKGLPPSLYEDLKLETMFDVLLSMLSDAFATLESENTKLSGKIFARDEEVDVIYRNSVEVMSRFMESNHALIPNALRLFLIVRKLERIGDHCNNIVEEIVFYVDAKVLKHSPKG